ncbi:(deoxy)nucleoside triphosphate pyrophosphohydrolase [Bacillus sp. SA1-12]|uniref:(deoxy)nucleoside triphosphate pyrophosphohydrolase n=1 Tax=Bacillus sp. SA1-12 TaxID=1455638 RepID=UPI000A52A368|nr:(deoxy)nucleoside triphosphate pyrophosphohydrolase [Bacillus sp. SA1-12]
MKTIKVVAAIIENDKNEILCALRSSHMSLPNMWEFPGGKVEKNEDIFHAIEREIKEELGCQVSGQSLFHENIHEYDTFRVHLLCITCKMTKGLPIPIEHAKLIWLKREHLGSLRWAPADLPAVKHLIKESSPLP